ncbi:beta-lactamase class C and other penicillin binding proteins [Anaerolinea thermolimosa]|uniref:serine hydrolase domain-containing protein n=1 Tax=Anaerolinea thermolimosa TaxID=229919 RepID=UPI000782A603|nr:serine hydrolase domain-containing protein [Anaerolinea thermolimosa]GAP05260.1 beta-lactamase class C and other penicillin binding proteins [Anaerolinea thermolimosa]
MHTTDPASVGFDPRRLQRVKEAMQRYVDRNLMAGIITLVARHGQVVHLEKVGWMDRENNKEMSLDAIFRIYSMSKPITSTAVMMLFEEGHFRLGDPVSRYIPAFKDMKVYQPRGNADYDLVPARREITIRDLLTHTAGLSYGFDERSPVDELYREKVWKRMDTDPDVKLETMIETIASLPLAHHPGEAWRYSMATDVLGYLVQVVSGKPFEVFLEERIFAPLGMKDTGFYVPEEKASRLTAVYGPAEGGGLKVIDSATDSSYLRKPKVASGGGGLVSTTADYLRFAQMILNRGILDGTRLLAPKTVELMMMNHLPGNGRKPDEPFNGFGLGGSVLLDVAGSQGYGSAGNWGWGGAANTWFWVDPREDLLGILMTQYMPGFVLPVTEDFKNAVYQALVA